MRLVAQVLGLVLALALLAVLVPGEWLLALGFGAGLLCWLWALLDCALHEPRTGSDRLVWTLIILGAQVVGAALYVGVRRPQRRAEQGHEAQPKPVRHMRKCAPGSPANRGASGRCSFPGLSARRHGACYAP